MYLLKVVFEVSNQVSRIHSGLQEWELQGGAGLAWTRSALDCNAEGILKRTLDATRFILGRVLG